MLPSWHEIRWLISDWIAPSEEEVEEEPVKPTPRKHFELEIKEHWRVVGLGGANWDDAGEHITKTYEYVEDEDYE